MKKAFTMIELVFVIIILGILSSVVISKMTVTRDDAEVAAGAQKLNHLITDIGLFYTAHGEYESNLSRMTNIVLVDNTKKIFNGNFITTPAYFSNDARTKLCLKIKVNDINGTLTISSENEGSGYCKSLVKVTENMLKTYYFGGSRIYN